MRRHLLLTVIAAAIACAAPAFAQQKPFKVALIEDKTGPLEAYAKQPSPGCSWASNTPPTAR